MFSATPDHIVGPTALTAATDVIAQAVDRVQASIRGILADLPIGEPVGMCGTIVTRLTWFSWRVDDMICSLDEALLALWPDTWELSCQDQDGGRRRAAIQN